MRYFPQGTTDAQQQLNQQLDRLERVAVQKKQSLKVEPNTVQAMVVIPPGGRYETSDRN